MSFLLSRGGNNIPVEVQRWQYFLLQRQISQIGRVDGDFGGKTEEATRIFQLQEQLPQTGAADSATLQAAASYGYRILPDNHYAERAGTAWPPKPGNLSSPTAEWRNQKLSCFTFVQTPLDNRDRPERIVMGGSCDGGVSDWRRANIVELPSSAFSHATGFRGYFLVHKRAREPLEELLHQWKEQSLLHLVISFEGAYDPRYIKGHNPGAGAQPAKRSDQASALSNHAFGTAFDINATWNWIGKIPALAGQKGCVRELVAAAQDCGFFWGGHFGGDRIDGMHFELARV